jgi:hypothetical protein
MNKFEQLIEFIINDEEDKAKELFHEVVVEKSRDIYESLMAEEEQVEESAEETVEEATDSEEEAVEESTEEVAEDAVEESFQEEITDEALGGDAADDLVDEIEADEEGIALEGDEEEDLEDRVVDLEDKLDELMAEFEELMNDEDAEEAPEMGDEAPEEMGAEEEEGEEEEVEMPMESSDEVVEESDEEQVDESVSLTAVKADNADHATNKTSPVAADGGKKEKLADAHPAKTEEEKGAPAPKAKELPHGTTKPDLKNV